MQTKYELAFCRDNREVEITITSDISCSLSRFNLTGESKKKFETDYQLGNTTLYVSI